MAKIESRLPFLHNTRHSRTNGPKSYTGQMSKYIIHDDLGLTSKFSDYDLDEDISSSQSSIPQVKVSVQPTNKQSDSQQPSATTRTIARPVSGLKPPASRLKKPMTPPKPTVSSTPSSGIKKPSPMQTIVSSRLPKTRGKPVPEETSENNEKTSSTVVSVPIPSASQKISSTKVAQPQSVSRHSTISQPVSKLFSKIGSLGQNVPSKVGKSVTKYSDNKLNGLPDSNQTATENKSRSKLSHPPKRSSQSNVSPKKITPASRISPPKQTPGSKESSKILYKPTNCNSKDSVTPNPSDTSTPVPVKTISRLTFPSKTGFGLKPRPVTTNKRSPTGTAEQEVQRTTTATLCEPLLLTTLVDSANIVQSSVTTHLLKPQIEVVSSSVSCVDLSYAIPRLIETALNVVSEVVTHDAASATSTISSIELDHCQVTEVTSLHAPLRLCSTNDDVYQVSPLAVSATESQCYTYLQHAQPSSYRKQLLNSFTIKEELSPTAEMHAKHIASSLPQPWLSADIISSNNNIYSSEPRLIIPEPPPSDAIPRLQSIEEDNESNADSDIGKPSAPFTFSTKMTGESIDDLISVSKQSKPVVKPQSLLGNLFSKIGGRRMLSRPQESPPRVRKSYSTIKNGDISRRKQSPRLQRKNLRNVRPQASVDKLSPKHKPLFQDDSPIRCKEAYYGGAHQHMLKPLENSTKAASLTPTSQDSILPMKEARVSRPTQLQVRVCMSGDSPIRSSTPIQDGNRPCRAEHMKIYNSSCEKYNTIASPSRSASNSSTPVQMSSAIMSRSLTSRKKRKGSIDEIGSKYCTITHYSPILAMGLPPCPQLSDTQVEQGNSALSKVSVAVRLKQSGEITSASPSSYVTVDSERGQLILRDPTNESNMAPSCRRQLAAVPKFFAFDTVFSGDVQQMDVCKGTVLDIVQSVLQGSDGCIVSFGHTKTGKSRSLIGVDSSCAEFGIIPTTISWLYQLIEEQKNKTGARFSIRITGLEIRGKNEDLTDLLTDCAPGQESGSTDQIQLTSTPVYGAQLENLHELRAPDAAKAGFFLDSALTTMHNLNENSETKGSHFLFTLHVYQHHVESKPSPGGALIAGGRSRLHFIDIGPCAKSSSDGSALTLAALGSTITALLNGQRHFPQKESKLATLLKDSVGHSNCKTCILVHISTQPSQYTDTLQILQLAARIHRMKVRRRNKISSNSSDDTGSTNSNLRRRRGIRMGTSTSLSDPDVSSSEQSVDTVIYVPGNKHRHAHHSSPIYRTNPVVTKHRGSNQVPAFHEQSKPSGVAYTSPYSKPGAVKKRLSDEETSSEGRRRMPRTNARVWPKANPAENGIMNQTEYWLDAPLPVSRDQWCIPGNSNSVSLPHNAPTPNSYYPPHPDQPTDHYTHYQQPHHNDLYPNNHYHSVQPDQSTHWISLAQYNGHPTQIGHVTQGIPARQAWAEPNVQQRGGAAANVTEVSKQELWVDGPTAFRKNIEGLTNNLRKDQSSPTKRQHRHHHHTGGDKSKHHRTPSRKHREAFKHCHQCGADIKAENKVEPIQKSEESKSPSKMQNLTEEPTVTIKPFVKDWVLRHSKNNTPTKGIENSGYDKGDVPVNPQNIDGLLENELIEQDSMQLTVDLGQCTDEQLTNLSNLPCSDSLAADSDDDQDAVQIDDSVSNVTADDRVGFESKEGSSYDGNSLSEEIVEVCDAACQTEFTDSDTHSLQSNTPQPNHVTSTLPATLGGRAATNSIGRNKRDSTEAFLNATLHGSMLRRPDGASDPSLHKELLSPLADRRHVDSFLQPKFHSNTLPRNTHLSAPVHMSLPPTPPAMEPIKLQPYLTSANQSASVSQSTNKQNSSSKKVNPVANGKLVPESTSVKPEPKIKKPGLFKQFTSESSPSNSNKTPTGSPGKKSKSSKLPSMRLSSKPKEGKPATSNPSTPSKKSDSSKKEKRSLIQPPSLMKTSTKTTSKLPAPGSMTSKPNGSFDGTSSPYRHYVLPKPSYSHSDGCSDNSSCPSYHITQYKYSVSSGYDSMTLNSADDVSQTTEVDVLNTQSEKFSTDPWLSNSQNGNCKQKDKVHHRRYEENKLTQDNIRQARIEELLYRQDQLKREMAETKARLMVPTTAWNYDSVKSAVELPSLHVASQIDRRNDEGYLEALEKETSILQKRVDACKSRIMLVTSIL